MSTETTEQKKQKEAEERELAERRKALGLSADAPIELIEAAEDKLEKGDEEADKKEAAVLDFLLGPTTALEYDVRTWIDTPKGRGPLHFHLKQLPDTRIEEIEEECSSMEGMRRVTDRKRLNAMLVAEATEFLVDASGRKVEVGSAEFRGPIPSASEAFLGRFRYQPGILPMVADEVRAAAGLTPDRVEEGKQVASGEETMAIAVKNS